VVVLGLVALLPARIAGGPEAGMDLEMVPEVDPESVECAS
jgi:hypothetical protein